MDEKPTFEELVIQWKTDRGRIPFEDETRILAYLDLFATLEMYGYAKYDVKRQLNFNQIVHHSHNPNAKRGSAWGLNCVRTLHMAIARYWPIATTTADPSRVKPPITYPEPSPAPERSTEVGYHPDPNDGQPTEETALVPSNTRREYTQEEWDAFPTPEPVYDLELRKLLGFDT